MPAAAVIPAPLAYTTIVAVKRLVVGLNTLYILHILYCILYIHLLDHMLLYTGALRCYITTIYCIYYIQHCE